MNKIYIIFTFCLLFTCPLVAQHLSFKGIPIDGQITLFQNRLSNNGFTYSSSDSKKAPAGERVFKGKYNGHNASLSVFFNRKTNEVYEVELSIESDRIDIIQNELDKIRKNIETQNAYFPEHDIEDGRNLHYRYHILMKSANPEIIGTIHIKPTYAYLFDEYGNRVQTLYVLQLNYEDKENSSLLTPSVTKPTIRNREYYANDPEKFYKYLLWATELKKGGDIDRQIDFLNQSLNWYKHNCVPPGIDISEQQIESEILLAQNKLVGKIPTWSDKTANVYKCDDDSYDEFFYIFPVNMGFYKFYPSEIKAHIDNMNKVYDLFMKKINETKNQILPDYWQEKTDFEFPMNYGEDTLNGPYGWGDIKWQKGNAFVVFEKSNDGIYITINNKSKSYMPQMLFKSPSDVEKYINTLRNFLY